MNSSTLTVIGVGRLAKPWKIGDKIRVQLFIYQRLSIVWDAMHVRIGWGMQILGIRPTSDAVIFAVNNTYHLVMTNIAMENPK